MKKSLTYLGTVLIFTGCTQYLVETFVSPFAPPRIEITKDYILTDGDFINGITIEKIHVDSIGERGYPVKYTTYYTTHCKIQHPEGRPPEPPSKIEFGLPGKYSWDEDTIKVFHIHKGFSRKSVSTSDKLWWLNKFGNKSICPIQFEKEQWYFFTIGDPRVTGVFFIIDRKGIERQYYLPSGVSPI